MIIEGLEHLLCNLIYMFIMYKMVAKNNTIFHPNVYFVIAQYNKIFCNSMNIDMLMNNINVCVVLLISGYTLLFLHHFSQGQLDLEGKH